MPVKQAIMRLTNLNKLIGDIPKTLDVSKSDWCIVKKQEALVSSAIANNLVDRIQMTGEYSPL